MNRRDLFKSFNPFREREENAPEVKVHINPVLCTNSPALSSPSEPDCSRCLQVCAPKAIRFTKEGSLPVLDLSLCNSCKDCISACPVGAILEEGIRHSDPEFSTDGFTLTRLK